MIGCRVIVHVVLRDANTKKPADHSAGFSFWSQRHGKAASSVGAVHRRPGFRLYPELAYANSRPHPS